MDYFGQRGRLKTMRGDLLANHKLAPLISMTHISLNHRYIYISTPKVASSSLLMTLQRLEWGDAAFLHDPTWEVHDRALSPLLTPLQVTSFEKLVSDRAFVKFCFVRNPFDRLISAYLNKVRAEDHFKERMMERLGKSGADVSFDEFVDFVVSEPAEEMDLHYAIQYYQTFHELIDFDFTGHFETFDSDITQVGRLIGIDIAQYLVRFDPHRTGVKNYSEYLTDRNLSLIREKYERDFTTFGYSRECPVSAVDCSPIPRQLA